MQRDAGASICGVRRWIEQGLEPALDEIQVCGTDAGLLRKGFFELPGLELEFRSNPDVKIRVADDGAGGRVRVGQNCEVKVRTIISLEAEARAADEEGVGRCAVAFVRTIIGIKVSIRTDAELTVRALYEKVFAIPSCCERRVFFEGAAVGLA
jgi:hypothetical protein